MAVLGVPMLLGPIFGPILGGWLIDIASRHLDLPDQPADRRDRTGLRRGGAAGTDHPVGRLRLRRHAAASPGLALFPYGVSSIPEAARSGTAKVLVTAVIGLVFKVIYSSSQSAIHCLNRS